MPLFQAVAPLPEGAGVGQDFHADGVELWREKAARDGVGQPVALSRIVGDVDDDAFRRCPQRVQLRRQKLGKLFVEAAQEGIAVEDGGVLEFPAIVQFPLHPLEDGRLFRQCGVIGEGGKQVVDPVEGAGDHPRQVLDAELGVGHLLDVPCWGETSTSSRLPIRSSSAPISRRR